MDIYNLSTGAITAVGVSLLVIFCMVGLIIWNNKAKEQVKTLKSIDTKIEEANKPPVEPAIVVEISDNPPSVEEEETPLKENGEAVPAAEPGSGTEFSSIFKPDAEIESGSDIEFGPIFKPDVEAGAETMIGTEKTKTQGQIQVEPGEGEETFEVAFEKELKQQEYLRQRQQEGEPESKAEAMADGYNVGRSGRVYSKSELFRLIRS